MTGHVRVGGAWKDLESVSVRVGGVWKTVEQGWTRVGGAWKEWYSASNPAYTLIGTTTLASDAASYTFSSIPQTYKHLELHIQARTTSSGADYQLQIIVNGSIGGVDNQFVYARDTSAVAGTEATSGLHDYPAGAYPTTVWGGGSILIPNYTASGSQKVLYHKAAVIDKVNSIQNFGANGISMNTTAAITSVQIGAELNSLASGTILSLYGIEG